MKQRFNGTVLAIIIGIDKDSSKYQHGFTSAKQCKIIAVPTICYHNQKKYFHVCDDG